MTLEFIMNNLIKVNNFNISINSICDSYESGIRIGIENKELLHNVFEVNKVEGLKEIIEFFNNNKYVFNIEKTHKIEILRDNFINFHFEGLFSANNIVQYDLKNEKFKLIVHGFVFALVTKDLTISKFNLMCYKMARHSNIHNQFAVKNGTVKLKNVNDFLANTNISFAEFTEEHFALIKIVEY